MAPHRRDAETWTPVRDSEIRLPDGRFLAYAEWGDLWTMDANGGSEVRLTETSRRDEYSRSWQALVP